MTEETNGPSPQRRVVSRITTYVDGDGDVNFTAYDSNEEVIVRGYCVRWLPALGYRVRRRIKRAVAKDLRKQRRTRRSEAIARRIESKEES